MSKEKTQGLKDVLHARARARTHTHTHRTRTHTHARTHTYHTENIFNYI